MLFAAGYFQYIAAHRYGITIDFAAMPEVYEKAVVTTGKIDAFQLLLEGFHGLPATGKIAVSRVICQIVPDRLYIVNIGRFHTLYATRNGDFYIYISVFQYFDDPIKPQFQIEIG
ncbi:MAG: hypothetical protein NC357_09035, partial [Bacteroides sp.]|nr:hypothetical protein [Bacteroides sp.]